MVQGNSRNFFKIWSGALIFLFFVVYLLGAPFNFPTNSIVSITEGASLRGISGKLKNENIIRSRMAFEALVIMYGGETRLISADYFLKERVPVWTVARRLVKGERRLAPVTLTIPEGYDLGEIAAVASRRLPNFNSDVFLAQAAEGYLFPDTYFFFTNDNEKKVIEVMSKNFEKKISSLRSAISASGKSEADIIIMASLIEREAKGDIDRAMISGILWKRISLDMPLQVDAALETYKKKGLTQKPICNPGLASIRAAIYPEKSDYLYYLHDPQGNIHYAKNFAEHKINKAKYLK